VYSKNKIFTKAHFKTSKNAFIKFISMLIEEVDFRTSFKPTLRELTSWGGYATMEINYIILYSFIHCS